MKKISLISIALLASLSLAGCGNQSTKKANSSSKVTSSKIIKHHKKTDNKTSQSKTAKSTTNPSSQDSNNPRVQALIQKGLLNSDGTPTRKGQDLNAMVEGKDLPQSDWDDSDYTEGYDDEHGSYRVPIYGNQNQNSSQPSNNFSNAPANACSAPYDN